MPSTQSSLSKNWLRSTLTVAVTVPSVSTQLGIAKVTRTIDSRVRVIDSSPSSWSGMRGILRVVPRDLVPRLIVAGSRPERSAVPSGSKLTPEAGVLNSEKAVEMGKLQYLRNGRAPS